MQPVPSSNSSVSSSPVTLSVNKNFDGESDTSRPRPAKRKRDSDKRQVSNNDDWVDIFRLRKSLMHTAKNIRKRQCRPGWFQEHKKRGYSGKIQTLNRIIPRLTSDDVLQMMSWSCTNDILDWQNGDEAKKSRIKFVDISKIPVHKYV